MLARCANQSHLRCTFMAAAGHIHSSVATAPTSPQTSGRKKNRPDGPVFLTATPRLLLVGGSSFSRLGSVSSRSSAFGGLGSVSGGSSSRSFGSGSGGSSSRSFSSGSRGRGRSGFFLLAASGDGQSNESSNQERLFHLLIPFMEERKVQIRNYSEADRGGSTSL